MEDFEYSVEICDRDWDCFFAECEECNLLSPSLAGADSGMSDFDETVSIFANIVQHSSADFPEAEPTTDAPPQCEGSPVDSYLSRRGALGGTESILSGSEEDIHLRSVNVFLERLRSDAEVEELMESRTPGPAQAEKQRDAAQEWGFCAGGEPEPSPTVNQVSTEDETAVSQSRKSPNGKETAGKDAPCSHSVGSINPLLKDNQPACFEEALLITEEVCAKTAQTEAMRSSQPGRSWNRVGSEAQMTEAQTKEGGALDEEREAGAERASLEGRVGGSCSKQDAVTHESANDDLIGAEPKAAKPNKSAGLDVSPSAAVKRKRRRRRRVLELAESVHGCERQDFVKSSDSEEEQCAFYTNELQNCVCSSPRVNFSASSCSVKVSAQDMRTNDPSSRSLQRSMCKMKSSLENSINNGKPDTSDNSGDPTAPFGHYSELQFEKSNRLDDCPAFQTVKTVPFGSESKQSTNAEAKPLCYSALPAFTAEVKQNENLSATKTLVGDGALISGNLSNTMYQQQRETGGHFKDQSGDFMENDHFSVPEVSTNGNAKPEQRVVSSSSENSPHVECAKLGDAAGSRPNMCLKKNICAQPKERPEGLSTWPKCGAASQSDSTAELLCPSDLTPVSSCCNVDTSSHLTSTPSQSIQEMSCCSCTPVSPNDLRASRDKTRLKELKEEDGHQSWSASNDAPDLKCDAALKAEDSAALIEAEIAPELAAGSRSSVFVMSSFWSEMEKLTINDILGLRVTSSAAPDRHLPPLQENEPAGGFDWSDSGFFTQLDEPKPGGTHETTCSIQGSVEDPSQNVNVCAGDIVPTPVTDPSQPSAHTGLRRISKNVSVQNLPALETGNYTWKRKTLQTLNEEDFEKLDDFTGAGVSKEAEEVGCAASRAKRSDSVSLRGLLDYIFGSRQSRSSPSATDDLSPSYSYGNSVPETYDHFFSEFDTETFFYPFIRAKDQVSDELVPLFSCSTSANRNIQYPEVYECFFASSSSDESSTESDEEESRGPIRVVTRLSRNSSSSRFPTDIYDCFFTEKDLKENLFWKNMFSFRNMSFSASRLKQQSLSNSLATVKPSVGLFQRTFLPVNSLGNQDVVLFDPALHPFKDGLIGQLYQQQFNLENLQLTQNPSK